MKHLITTLAISSLSLLSAIAGPVNKKCPVSGKDIDEDHIVSYSVTFCCENCKGKFDADPIAFAEKISKAEEGKCPISGKAADEDQTSELKIATCCGKCETKVKEDPKPHIAKLKAE